MRNRTVSFQPRHEEIVLEHAQKTEPPSQGNRARVPKPDPGQWFGIGREKKAPVPSRPPPEGKAAPFQRCMRPAKANGCLLDPADRVAVESRKKVPPSLQGSPLERSRAEEPTHTTPPGFRDVDSLGIGGHASIAGMLQCRANAEIESVLRAQDQKPEHSVFERVRGAVGFLRLLGDFSPLY